MLYYNIKKLASFCKCFTDINECDTNNGDCQHSCRNTYGSFNCYCRPGYSLMSDGKKCMGRHFKIHKKLFNENTCKCIILKLFYVLFYLPEVNIVLELEMSMLQWDQFNVKSCSATTITRGLFYKYVIW
jgi:hypothetical protein